MLWLEMSRDPAHGGVTGNSLKVFGPPTHKKGPAGGVWPFWESLLKVRAGDTVFHLKLRVLSGYFRFPLPVHRLTDESRADKLSRYRLPSSLQDNMPLKQSARIIVFLFLAGSRSHDVSGPRASTRSTTAREGCDPRKGWPPAEAENRSRAPAARAARSAPRAAEVRAPTRVKRQRRRVRIQVRPPWEEIREPIEVRTPSRCPSDATCAAMTVTPSSRGATTAAGSP
jgi:hypothetical protein